MTLPWFKFFRIDTTSPMLFALEERVGDAALAHLVKLFAALPDEVIDGDLTGIADRAIESWAQWKGAAGDFARALRSTGWITADGHLWAWNERQAAVVAKAFRDAKRPAGRTRQATPSAGPARDKRGPPPPSRSESRAGQARGANAYERGGGEVDGASRAALRAGPARDARGTLSNLNSNDPNLDTRESSAGPPRDEAQRAEDIGAIAAQLAHEIGADSPPIDIGSPEYMRWCRANPEVFENARRVVDGEVTP